MWKTSDCKFKCSWIVLIIYIDYTQEFKHCFNREQLEAVLDKAGNDEKVYDFVVYKRQNVEWE